MILNWILKILALINVEGNIVTKSSGWNIQSISLISLRIEPEGLKCVRKEVELVQVSGHWLGFN